MLAILLIIPTALTIATVPFWPAETGVLPERGVGVVIAAVIPLLLFITRRELKAAVFLAPELAVTADRASKQPNWRYFCFYSR